MANDWPFLHLNLLSPNPSSREISSSNLNPNNPQDLSLHSIELDRQLEAWTNIDFNFDLDPITPDPNLSSTNNHHHHRINESVHENSRSFDELFSFPPTTNFFQQSNPTTNHNSSSYLVPNLPTPILNESLPAAPISIPDSGLDSSSQDLSIQFSPKAILPVPSATSVSQSPESQTHQHKNEGTPSTEKPELDDDEANKVAMEDDKRRRNTLASARFRMKKKLKEQEIERAAKEMKDKVNELEKEVESLKQENKWLRGLIVEQAANKSAPLQSMPRELETNLNSTHPEPTHETESLTPNPTSRTVKSNPKKSTSNAKRVKLSK